MKVNASADSASFVGEQEFRKRASSEYKEQCRNNPGSLVSGHMEQKRRRLSELYVEKARLEKKIAEATTPSHDSKGLPNHISSLKVGAEDLRQLEILYADIHALGREGLWEAFTDNGVDADHSDMQKLRDKVLQMQQGKDAQETSQWVKHACRNRLHFHRCLVYDEDQCLPASVNSSFRIDSSVPIESSGRIDNSVRIDSSVRTTGVGS